MCGGLFWTLMPHCPHLLRVPLWLPWACHTEDETRCNCHDGWSGSRCEVSLLQCLDNCNGHGNCMSGACSCHAPYEGSACEKLSTLMENSSSAVQPDIVSTLSLSSKTKKADTGDSQDSPMTVSWLQPAKFVQPAADKVAELVKLSSTSSSDTSARATAATSDDNVLWHPAVAPSAAAATPGDGKGSSISGLLSTKVAGTGKATWAERPSENTVQGSSQQSPSPRNLLSLLSRSQQRSLPGPMT